MLLVRLPLTSNDRTLFVIHWLNGMATLVLCIRVTVDPGTPLVAPMLRVEPVIVRPDRRGGELLATTTYNSLAVICMEAPMPDARPLPPTVTDDGAVPLTE